MSQFFTFGGGSPFANHYVEIVSDNYDEARNLMFHAFGPHWAFQYSEADFKGQPERFSLNRLCTLRRNEFGHWRPDQNW